MHNESRPRPAQSADQSLSKLCMGRAALALSVLSWRLADVEAFLRSFSPEQFDSKGRPPGFDILNRRFLNRGVVAEKYPEPESFPCWQRQERGARSSSTFDRALVAQVGPEIVGIVYCEWLRMPGENAPWVYALSMVDVHEAWRGRGVATALLRALDEQPWLSDKILWLNGFTPLGRERLPSVLKRELAAQNYIVLAPTYEDSSLPTAPGAWVSPTKRVSEY